MKNIYLLRDGNGFEAIHQEITPNGFTNHQVKIQFIDGFWHIADSLTGSPKLTLSSVKNLIKNLKDGSLCPYAGLSKAYQTALDYVKSDEFTLMHDNGGLLDINADIGDQSDYK